MTEPAAGAEDLDECDNPDISRLEYAPHRVYLELDDGEFRPTGYNDLIDGSWRETDSYWCHGCDNELDGQEAAQQHVLAALSRGAEA